MSNEEDKSPYGKFTIQEVLEAESGRYVIQVGGDLFEHEGAMAFKKDRAEKFYENILEGLNDMKKNGNETEKEDALRCLVLLRMYPLRIH